MLSATGKCHTCGNESWVDECAECWKARQYEQRTFLDLKGALERLCRAQTHLPDHWRSDAQQAINIVQEIGSSVCPDSWSKQVMCGDRVLAGQWSGVVAAQHGPFSWVVIDGINVPQTHATITLRPVENSDGE